MIKRFIMHKDSMDIMFEVHKQQYRDDKRRKLRGIWWNLGYTGNPWTITVNPQTITILSEDISKWKIVTEDQRNTPRTKPGRP